MIYTIGHTESYISCLISNEIVYKLGKKDDYPGGSVWKTEEEAQKHCEKDYSVFGVIADWENDTEETEDSWNNLLYDREIVQLN